MNTNTQQLNRGDGSIQNFLRMLRPILEEKELIGKRVKATEIAKLCRSHHRRLPVNNRRALELAEELISFGRGSCFIFDDLEIGVYMEMDYETRRRSPEIEFQLAVSLERQYLNSLQEQAQKDMI